MNKLIALLLAAALPLLASDISPGLSLGTGSGQISDGQRLTSAKLLQLVSDATIQPIFYTGKVGQSNLVAGDTLLVVSGASGTFHRLTGDQALLKNYHLITDQTVYSTIAGYDAFLLYDPTNNVFAQVAFSNLMASGALHVVVSNLVFATTNGQKLPLYGSLPDPTSTNNAPFTVVWDTNGVPSSLAYSNFIDGMVGTLGSNKLVGAVFRELFLPETLYATNNATNIWGWTNVVPVTNLFFGTNSALFTNNLTVRALTNSDTFPFRSKLQGDTNNTVTLDALTQWMSNNIAPTYVFTNAIPGSSGIVTNAHGLGAIPLGYRVFLQCSNFNLGYGPGDLIDVSSGHSALGTSADGTNVYVHQVNSATINVIPKTGGAFAAISNGTWRLKTIVRP